MQNQTGAERVHIGFFGLRNAGKSSVANAVLGQSASVVSDVAGTTTDPVKKAMELLPAGPVVIWDTPGIDDIGALGTLRVNRTMEMLEKTDVAVLVTDCTKPLCKQEQNLLAAFQKKNIPYLICANKSDLQQPQTHHNEHAVYVSAKYNTNIDLLKEQLGRLAKTVCNEKTVLAGLVKENDVVILVTPIDAAAPKGRLILPQQQVLREVLDCGGQAVVVQPPQLTGVLKNLAVPPQLVICDSQAADIVAKTVPDHIALTTFSILFARYKGKLAPLAKGANVLDDLKNGDRVLISEGCTHHRQCGDIGSQKLPQWILEYTKKNIDFTFTSGESFPADVTPYRLIIHCGGCMLTPRAMQARMRAAAEQNVPMTNYGIAISAMFGILSRTMGLFEEE